MTLRFWIKLFLLFSAANFFLHFAWEFLQIPFFKGMPEADHIEGVWTCTVATFGDTGIALVAYFAAAWSVRSLTWFETWRLKPASVYFLTGILITVVFEFLATEVLGRWSYGSNMPTLPLLGTGLTPLLQWLIVPALALAAVRLMYFGLLYLDSKSGVSEGSPEGRLERTRMGQGRPSPSAASLIVAVRHQGGGLRTYKS